MGRKKGPLHKIRVLDFTRVYAGPYCTLLLGDMGADIIKIEQPEIGDDTRNFLPIKNGESGYFMYLNRNKKSMTLNLKSDEGRKIALQLAKDADVIVENFSPGTMKSLGLDYEIIQEINPDIIYASISGFGQTGPLKKKVAYDIVAQAMSGLIGVTGYPEYPPVKVGCSIADANVGVHCALGIVSALFYRECSGKGQYIDVAMLDSIVSVMENLFVQYTLSGVIPQRIGNDSKTTAPFAMFNSKDSYVVIAASNNKIFKRLVAAMGKTELLENEKFNSNQHRVENFEELKNLMETWTMQYTTEEIVTMLDEARVPVAPILSIKEVTELPQLKERDMFIENNHPVCGKFLTPGFPIKFSETPGSIKKAAPLLGEDTFNILKNMLNLSDEEIEKLKAKHVI